MEKSIQNGCCLQLAANGTRLDSYCSLRTGAVGIVQASMAKDMVFSPSEHPDRLQGMAFVSEDDDSDASPCIVCLDGVKAEDAGSWRRGTVAGVWAWSPPPGSSYIPPTKADKWVTVTAGAPGVLLLSVVYDETSARERLYATRDAMYDGRGGFVPTPMSMYGVGVIPADYATIGVRSEIDLEHGALALDCRPGVFFHRPWRSCATFPPGPLELPVVLKWVVDQVWWTPGQEGVLSMIGGCVRAHISNALSKAVQAEALPFTSIKSDGTCCACIGALALPRLAEIVWAPQGSHCVYELHP
jgi:hypothetical protein